MVHKMCYIRLVSSPKGKQEKQIVNKNIDKNEQMF